MKITPQSSTRVLDKNPSESAVSPQRTTASYRRYPAPAPAAAEVLLVSLTIMLGLLLGAATSRAQAEEPVVASDAGALILRSHAFVAGMPSFEIEQTKVERITPLQDGKPAGAARRQTSSLVIRTINGDPMVTELLTADASGQPLRAIRRGERVALKIGTGPWQVPSGPYAQLREATTGRMAE